MTIAREHERFNGCILANRINERMQLSPFRGPDAGYLIPMLVSIRINEMKQDAMSVVRLRPLDDCDMLCVQSFKVGLDPAIEVLWRLTNRKISFLLLIQRLTGIQFVQGMYGGAVQDGPVINKNRSDCDSNGRKRRKL